MATDIDTLTGETVELRVARIGAAFILLQRAPRAQWRIHRRFRRDDMPAELQVGLTTYTDWNRAQRISPEVHNRTVIRDGRPDLIASFDFVRFQPIEPPGGLRNRDLANAGAVSDADLLGFLGRSLDRADPTTP